MKLGSRIKLLITIAVMAGISFAEVPHTFTGGTPARASEINENFRSIDARLSVQEATTYRFIGVSAVGADTTSMADIYWNRCQDTYGPNARLSQLSEILDGSIPVETTATRIWIRDQLGYSSGYSTSFTYSLTGVVSQHASVNFARYNGPDSNQYPVACAVPISELP